MKIWLLWAWMVGMVWCQEEAKFANLPWDHSSWEPILGPCVGCREGKKVDIRPAQMEKLSFNPVPSQQQKRQVQLDQLSFKPVLVQQQKPIFPLETTSIPKLDKALTKDQEYAAQTKLVRAQRLGVHQQQIVQHQQRTKQKQQPKVFPVPLVHSEQVFQPIQNIDFSDKVKRDQDGSLVLGGSPNSITNNLLMTLVTSKGQEADAQAKLSLLEAALTSQQPNHQQDGRLPRIFIAPSHVPPPPGYVKIALVPQADAASQPRHTLPSTFLTPNAHNLSPSFVKLDLPHSVSHLSRDIPVVVPNDQIAPNPLGLPHLNPLVSRPEASLNIQTPDERREAKAISSGSPIVQIVPKDDPSTVRTPQTTSRPPPPLPTTPGARPIPSAFQTTARPPPPPPPPQFSHPPPQFQQQQRFPPTPSPFAPRPPFTAFPGAPIPGQQFNGPPRFIPGQPQTFQSQGFPQPTSQFRPGQPFPASGQLFPAPGQPFQAPGQTFPGAPQQFPGSPQQVPHRFNNGAPVQFGQPPNSPSPFRPNHSVFRNPNPTFRPDFPQISELTPKPIQISTKNSELAAGKPIHISTNPRPTPIDQTSTVTPTTPTTPKPTPKPTTLRPIPVTSSRPIPTSTPRILSVTPPLRPTPKAFEFASPNPQIFSQGSPKPHISSTPFKINPAAQPTPSPFPSSPFPSSQFPSSPFPPSPFQQTSRPGSLPPRPTPQTLSAQPTPSPFPSSPFPSSPFPQSPFQQTSKPGSLPPRPAPPTSPFTNQPTPSPVPSTTPLAPRSPVIPGFLPPGRTRFPSIQETQKPRIPSFVETERPRFPAFQETQKPRIPSFVETERPTTTVKTQRPKNPIFQVPRRPFQPIFTETRTPEIGKSAAPEVLEAERAGFQSIETSVPTLVNSEKPLIPSFQRPKIQTLKPKEVTSSPVTTTSEKSTTTTTTTTVTTPEPTIASSTTSGSNVTTFKPRFRNIGGRRRPFLRRKPIKRIKKPIKNVQDVGKPEEEKREETSTLFPPFSVANRLNQLRKKEELGGAIEDPKLGITIPPRGTFGRRLRPRTRLNSGTSSSSDSNSKSEPVNGRRLPSWLEQRRRHRLRTTTTQKTPVVEAHKIDTPVDILDSNEFTGAESALVVVSQPAENSAFNYKDVAKNLQEKEKVLRNEQLSVAVKAAEDALLHYADVVEDEVTIEKDLSAIKTLTHSGPVSEIDYDYEIYEPEPEPEAAAPEPEPEPTFDDAVYEENTEEVTVANLSAQVIEEESTYPEPEPEPKPNTEYVDQYFDYEDTLEDSVTTTLPFVDDLKHIPSSKPHLPYSTLVEISLDSHRSDIPIESSLEPEYAPVEHDDLFVAPSDSLEDQDILLEADTATDTPLDNVTEQPLLFDTQPQIIINDPEYNDYYDYDDYVDSFGDGSDQSFGGSVSQVIYAVPASDWSPDEALISEDSSVGASGITLSVTDNSVGASTVSSIASESTSGSSNVFQGVTDQESPKVVEPPADEVPVTTEVYLGNGGAGLFNTETPEDLFLLDESLFDDMITTTIPETTWASFSVKPITITPPTSTPSSKPPTSTPSSKPPKENQLNKAHLEEMKWSVRGPKVLSHSVITESRTSNARVCFSDGTCFDASGIRR